MKFNKQFAEEYLNNLLKQHKIKVVAYSSSSCGRANFKKKEIKIPKPTNLDRFGVCLHEVKHIIDGNRGSRYEQEFACDLYALNIFKELGYETAKWEERMRWHSLSRLAMAVNRGLSLSKINLEIREFFKDVDFKSWENHKVFVKASDRYNDYSYSINLTPNLNKEDIETLLNKKGLMLTDGIHNISGEFWIVSTNGNQKDERFFNLNDIINRYDLKW